LPVVIRHKGFKYFFFSNEGQPREPLHIHVRQGERTAKIWIEPVISVAESYKMTSKELKEIIEVVQKQEDFIRRSWNEHFSK